jgi:hypothetical protein
VPLGKSGKEEEVALSGQKEEGEMEMTVGDEKGALCIIGLAVGGWGCLGLGMEDGNPSVGAMDASER